MSEKERDILYDAEKRRQEPIIYWGQTYINKMNSKAFLQIKNILFIMDRFFIPLNRHHSSTFITKHFSNFTRFPPKFP